MVFNKCWTHWYTIFKFFLWQTRYKALQLTQFTIDEPVTNFPVEQSMLFSGLSPFSSLVSFHNLYESFTCQAARVCFCLVNSALALLVAALLSSVGQDSLWHCWWQLCYHQTGRIPSSVWVSWQYYGVLASVHSSLGCGFSSFLWELSLWQCWEWLLWIGSLFHSGDVTLSSGFCSFYLPFFFSFFFNENLGEWLLKSPIMITMAGMPCQKKKKKKEEEEKKKARQTWLLLYTLESCLICIWS